MRFGAGALGRVGRSGNHADQHEGEFAELRGNIAADLSRLDAKIDSEAAESLKVTVLTSLTSGVLFGGYVTAVLGCLLAAESIGADAFACQNGPKRMK